jgi:unsaturated rhamnogalacturonyl hydrolase
VRLEFLISWVLFISILLTATCVHAQDLPSRTEILADLRLVQDHWIAANPDPGNRGWARAAYFTGHMAAYAVSPRSSDLNYAFAWADSNNWTLFGGPTTRNADHQCCGQTYIALDAISPDLSHLADITTSIFGMVDSTPSDDWWWCDALFMAMPVFTGLGNIYGDDRYYDKLYDLYTDTKTTRGLYDSDHHLWYRDEDFMPPFTTPNGAPCFWSRGNGWVFAGHARVLADLPLDDPHRAEYVTTFQEMAAALTASQRADGFWNVSLADTTDFPGPETSGTGFFAYGLAWGVRNGLLDEAVYLPAAVRAWEGITTVAVHSDGFLGYVQGVGSEPASNQPVTWDDTTDFGVGAYLLAGSEMFLLADGASEVPVAEQFYLTQNVPNPFNPATQVRFYLPSSGPAHITIYDLAGRCVITLIDADLSSGHHAVTWRGLDTCGRSVPSGTYIYRLDGPGFGAARRMTLIR